MIGRRLKALVRRRYGIMLFGTAGLALLTLWDDPRLLTTLTYAAVWALYCLGYDLFSGYSGRVNLGYALFPGLAAYTTALLNVKLGVSPYAGMIAGVLVAVTWALAIGVLTLRIRGIYFALSTAIAPLVLFQLAMIFWDLTGGEEGLFAVEPLFLELPVNFLVSLVLLAVIGSFCIWLTDSKTGLVLRAIQGSEIATQAAGKRTFKYLLATFVVSAVIGGLAGGFLAHFQMYIGPEVFQIETTLQIITFALLGGSGTLIGPFVAAFLLMMVNEYLRLVGDIRLLLYFIILVLILRFSPRGIIVPLGERLLGRQV